VQRNVGEIMVVEARGEDEVQSRNAEMQIRIDSDLRSCSDLQDREGVTPCPLPGFCDTDFLRSVTESLDQ
jgi:hypothetical protein